MDFEQRVYEFILQKYIKIGWVICIYGAYNFD
jgi:hypothetical protein